MPATLVQHAIEQSRNREPSVRTMALLYGSRVLAAVDKDAAKRAFAEGVAFAGSLLLDARHIEFVLEDAVRLGTMADPIAAVALFRRLPPGERPPWRSSTGTMLVHSLVQSGDFERALGLLEDLTCEAGGAGAVVHSASDPAVQRRAMLAARERWRAFRKRPDSVRVTVGQHDFHRLFGQHWRRLHPDEQESWLDEILQAVEADPDYAVRAGFGERVNLHSIRDVHLFEILNVLHALKPPDQVQAILRAHPGVADAAKVYPLGLESLLAEQRPISESRPCEGGFRHTSSGSRSDTRLVAGTMAAHPSGPSALRHLLAEAHQLYLEDTDANDPNLAPRVFWPSCHAYRLAMYRAGKESETGADPLLAEIPDKDFGLLASIELAAGALGLPQYSGVRMGHHSKGAPRS